MSKDYIVTPKGNTVYVGDVYDEAGKWEWEVLGTQPSGTIDIKLIKGNTLTISEGEIHTCTNSYIFDRWKRIKDGPGRRSKLGVAFSGYSHLPDWVADESMWDKSHPSVNLKDRLDTTYIPPEPDCICDIRALSSVGCTCQRRQWLDKYAEINRIDGKKRFQ